MFIEEIKLSLFKGFKDFTITCSPFTCLVGLNSKGKTSILQAVQLIHDLFVFVFGGKERPDFGSPQWQFSPSQGLNRLSFGDPDAIWLHKRTSEPCKIIEKLSDGVELLAEVKGRDRYDFDIRVNGSSIKGKMEQPENRKIIEDIFEMRPTYIPPVGAVSPTENFMSVPQLRSELDQGRITEHWRSRLYWLWNDGRKEFYDKIVELVLRYLPEARILPPRLTHDSPPRVLIEFEEEETTFDISASGGGLRTLLNLANVLHFSKSQCVLCDEPDSHLHSSLQTGVARMLLDFSLENGCQVLVATHAPDFIAEVPVESLVWVDRTQNEGLRCGNLGQVLAELGSISKADAVRTYGADKILFVEGSVDGVILRHLFGLTLDKNLFDDTTIIVAKLPNGKGDAVHLKIFRNLLKETLKLPVTVACVTDNDYELGTTTEEPTTEIPLVLSLSHKEVENYFLDPVVIFSAIQSAADKRKERTGQIVQIHSLDQIEEKLSSIVESSEVRDIVRWQVVPRYRKTLKKDMDPSERERQADKWFDSKWEDVQWRKRNCPGKQVLKKIRDWCQKEYGLTLTDKLLIDSLSECPADIADIAQKISAYFSGKT